MLSAVLLMLGLCIRALPAQGEGEPSSPCPEGSYRSPEGCLLCDVCDEGRSYLRPCGPGANAVCRCPAGRECGGNTCVRCSCPKGHQLKKEGGCERCPHGEFSTGASGPCRPWRRCPGRRVQAPGTEESDVVCQPEPGPPHVESPTTKEAGPSTRLLLPGALAAAALLACLLVLLFFCRLRVRGKPQEEPCRQPVQEQDDCSYCFPEEEEGGSSSSGSEGFGAKWEPLLEKVP